MLSINVVVIYRVIFVISSKIWIDMVFFDCLKKDCEYFLVISIYNVW